VTAIWIGGHPDEKPAPLIWSRAGPKTGFRKPPALEPAWLWTADQILKLIH